MKYILKNKEIELTAEEVAEIVKQNQAPAEEKKIVINTIFGGIKFQSTKTTLREAILEKYSSDADLSGANLRGADLSDADLSGANLRDANLRGADLSDADLSDADLSGANLRDANLSGADLSDANLRGADLSDADLSDAELMSAKFYGRGGNKPLKRSQLPDFLGALGFIIEE